MHAQLPIQLRIHHVKFQFCMNQFFFLQVDKVLQLNKPAMSFVELSGNIM